MTVYVDGTYIRSDGRMKMCHMIADTMPELHNMAHQLGLSLSWFHIDNCPHYHISQATQARAIQYGAVRLHRRQLVKCTRLGKNYSIGLGP